MAITTATPLDEGQETIRDCLGVNNRMAAGEYPPGIPAPLAGIYEQRNVLGSLTGVQITMAQGEALPAAPRGCTWSFVETRKDADRAEFHPDRGRAADMI